VFAWHYTTGEKFKLIVESGFLLPTTAHISPGEKPVLWFSTHPYFEPTARKAFRERGTLRILDVPELYQRAGGLIRFGLPTSDLLSWEAIKGTAGMGRQVRRTLESSARRQGANPSDWWGCFEPVSVRDCKVEVMEADLLWVPVSQEDSPQASPLQELDEPCDAAGVALAAERNSAQ
jgi:hypothetical protein